MQVEMVEMDNSDYKNDLWTLFQLIYGEFIDRIEMENGWLRCEKPEKPFGDFADIQFVFASGCANGAIRAYLKDFPAYHAVRAAFFECNSLGCPPWGGRASFIYDRTTRNVKLFKELARMTAEQQLQLLPKPLKMMTITEIMALLESLRLEFSGVF